MKKEEFLAQLRVELHGLGAHEVEEILRDQQEFIHDAVASGRNEEEVVKSLGSPKNFADSLRFETHVKKIQDTEDIWGKSKEAWKASVTLIALMPLNLFLILVPGITVLSFLFTWLSLGISLFIIGFIFVFISFFSVLFGFTLPQLFGFLLLSIGTTAAGVSMLALLYKVLQMSFDLLVKYLNWNIKVFKGAKL